MVLHEETNDIHVYIDDRTGNYYYYDGTKLVLLGSKPTIGDRGNKALQDAEEQERQDKIAKEKEKQAQKNKSQNDQEKEDGMPTPGGDSEEGQNSDKSSQDSGDSSSSNNDDVDSQAGDGFGRPEDTDIESDAELKRLKRIKDAFNNPDTLQKLSREAEDRVYQDRQRKAAKAAAAYRNAPINRFKESLKGFIRKEVGEEENTSWAKINKKYAGTGTIKPGISRYQTGKIPLINVYFDRSSSWNAEKTKVGRDAIAVLYNYVRQHKIKINLYYFNTRVFEDDLPGGQGNGGTAGQPILVDIMEKKPDNVIILTDSDITDCRSYVTVPGAVWFLFKGGVSENLREHLQGKKLTRSFELDS